MLYFIYGNDRTKGLKHFQKLRDKLSTGGTNVVTVEEGGVSDGLLEEMALTRGLFGETTLFIINNILEKKEEQEVIVSHAQTLASSQNHFLIFEPTFAKDIVEGCLTHVTETFEYVAPKGLARHDPAGSKVDTRPAFNIFSLGDALGDRNKKDLWVLYQRAVSSGLSSEEICGTLLWSVKNMALMKSAKSGDDMGMKPFVARKTRGFAAKYTVEEVARLSRGLVRVYHEAHRGGEPMEIGLERFILSL